VNGAHPARREAVGGPASERAGGDGMSGIGGRGLGFGSQRATVSGAAGLWWLFLFTGGIWLVFSIVVFRFDWTSVSSISILFGILMLGAAVNELLAIAGGSAGWTIWHILLALAFLVIGIVSFVHPGGTFRALAAVISVYFVIKGFFDVVIGISQHGEELWWLRMLIGFAELVIGFWAAGDFGNREILLVVWVGVAALTRGITEILLAFALRSAGKAEAAA
jgi:uncharacterized membrane protein HdeD (DUF308 family)